METFFPHSGTVEENTWHFEVLLLFLSLKNGGELGRSRFVQLVVASRFGWKLQHRIFSSINQILKRHNLVEIAAE